MGSLCKSLLQLENVEYDKFGRAKAPSLKAPVNESTLIFTFAKASTHSVSNLADTVVEVGFLHVAPYPGAGTGDDERSARCGNK